MAFAGKIAHTHNNGTKSLTFTETLTKKQRKPKIVRTANYNCAYASSSNNLPCFPPDSHQSQNAVYWRTGEQRIKCFIQHCRDWRTFYFHQTEFSSQNAFNTILVTGTAMYITVDSRWYIDMNILRGAFKKFCKSMLHWKTFRNLYTDKMHISHELM